MLLLKHLSNGWWKCRLLNILPLFSESQIPSSSVTSHPNWPYWHVWLFLPKEHVLSSEAPNPSLQGNYYWMYYYSIFHTFMYQAVVSLQYSYVEPQSPVWWYRMWGLWKVIRFRWGHEGGALYKKRKKKYQSFLFPPREDTGEGGHQQSTAWEEGLHQESNL